MNTDVLIIGGGVIGASIAHRLAKYNLDITLVEKENDLCMGTSKANSAMIHSGFNIDGNTLKGKLTLEANPQYKQLCTDLHVEHVKPLGSILVGFKDEDMALCNKYLEMGTKNGIKGMRILSREELFEMEPNLNPEAQFGLYDPATGIINPFEFTVALAENAVINGAKVLLNTEVQDIITENKTVKAVKTNKGTIEAKVVINAAGLFADKIASMVEDIDFEIKPRKGQYFLYDKKWGKHINHAIYSSPTKVSKGLIMLPTSEGNLIAGSNAETIEDKTNFSTTQEAMDGIYKNTISHYFPKLPRMGDVITTFAGLRAASNTEDFIIEHAKTVKGFINVAGIQSPGLSSAPAIARMVEDLIKELEYKLDFSEKKNYEKGRPKPVILRDLPKEEVDKIIQEDPDFGEIVCRCETVSKGEILQAIHRVIPATDVDAVKRRVRAGMGRCQGGFCGPRVHEILSEELNIDPLKVTKKGKDSYILSSRNKEQTIQAGGEKIEKIKL